MMFGQRKGQGFSLSDLLRNNGTSAPPPPQRPFDPNEMDRLPRQQKPLPSYDPPPPLPKMDRSLSTADILGARPRRLLSAPSRPRFIETSYGKDHDERGTFRRAVGLF